MDETLRPRIKEVLVKSLRLPYPATEIADDIALFGEGLGLDSIDALELAMAIERRFGVKFAADDDRNREIFANVKNLAAYVAEETRS